MMVDDVDALKKSYLNNQSKEKLNLASILQVIIFLGGRIL